ncbi:MAG: type IX secretion system sortase PorU [Bacteroidales bacterium]
MPKLNFEAFSTNILSIFLAAVFSFLFVAPINAQNSSKEDLSWEPVKTVYFDSSSAKVLSFDNARYEYSKSYLPFFEERLPLPSKEFEVNLTIKNTTYKKIPADSIPDFADSGKITSTLQTNIRKRVMRKQSYASFRIYPFKKSENGDLLLLESFEYEASYTLKPQKDQNKIKHTYVSKSALASGKWHKLRVNKTGIHKITYEDLENYGLPVSSLDPEKIQIYGNGGSQLPYANNKDNPDDLIENAIYISDGDDGSFDQDDYILFYAEGPVTWDYDNKMERFTHHNHEYDDYAYYFLTYGQTSGKRIQQINPPSGNANIHTSSYNSYRSYNKDSLNLLKSGRLWFGRKFDIETQYNFNFNFPELDNNSPVKFRTYLAARHTGNSQFDLTINGNKQNVFMAAIGSGYNDRYASASIDTFSLDLNSGAINCNIKYSKPANSAMGWLNYIEINARENLTYNNTQLPFRDISMTGQGNIAEYTLNNATGNINIWDVTDPQNPTIIDSQTTGNDLKFKATADTLREFIAHKNNYYTPKHLGYVENQNLHGLGFNDMVIVTHPKLRDEAEELADIHRDIDNMTIHVVEPQKIYNEFSSGQQDVTAIRNFMRMFYTRASNDAELPRYLLFMGDGNYDPKNRNNNDETTVITFQSSNSLDPTKTYVTDDYFGLFDEGEGPNAQGDLDIGIGRIPAANKQQAQDAITKIKRYLNLDTATMNNDMQQNVSMVKTLQDWRNKICFIADDEDNNLHITQADNIATKLQKDHPSYILDKIYFDAYKQVNTPGGQRYPDVTKDINERVEKGALILNYVGHGGVAGWADEEVLRINDINSWNNKYNLPVFMTATCEFSRFDDPGRVSAGEYVFRNPNGGGISLFTTTRLAYSGANGALNRSFYNNLFRKENGEHLRMGDLMRYSKTGSGSSLNTRNFVLLGDPALSFAFPEKQVYTTRINNQDTSITDTLGALTKVSVEGIVGNQSGNIDSTFNGIIYPTVYDKASTYYTLGQDKSSDVKEFQMQDNVLYKGKAKVENGKFTFSFVIPKDIAYNLGKGKIVYYAENGITDARGYYDNFIIGGTSDSATTDTTGPEISLYMNDFSFESGDITDENPVLLARVFDENGINTVGNGIGHDIVAVLDQNTDQQIVLNDYYEADMNSYKRGTIQYPFQDLPEGRHTLTVKVWDVHNNSSSASIEFVVTKSEHITIKHLKAYPNPSEGKVWFTFDHNQAGAKGKFKVDIYSLNGQLIESLETEISPDGYSVSPLMWNGRTQSGAPVDGGMYIYRATLQTSTGISKQKSGKIVLLN